MKKTRCYIYARVSTAIQVDGYSLDAQKDKLRKYAEFQDMEIVGEYSDEGHSGKNIKGRIAAVAEMERENIRVQTMAWREQKAREGKWNGDLLLMDISWKMVNFPVYEGKFIKQL